jgi:hypothetical protein
MKMFNAAVAIFIIVCGFIGCDDEGSGEAKRYERQQALDRGDYARVLELTNACGGDQDCLLDRGGAYMGLAGLDAPTIVEAVTDDNKAYFARLSSFIKTNADVMLDSAKSTYEEVIKKRGYVVANCGDAVLALNRSEKDACANYGLAAIGKSAALANDIAKRYDQMGGGCNTVSVCFPSTSADVNVLLSQAVDLVFQDSDALVSLISKNGADTKKKVDEIKSEICASLSPCDAANVKSNLDNMFQYIINNK